MSNGNNNNPGKLYKKKGGKEYPANSRIRAPYYVRYSVNGKQKRQVLKDADGNRIYRRDEAEQAKLELLRPFVFKDKVQQLKTVKNMLQSAEEKAEEAEGPAIPVSELWERYLPIRKRMADGATLKQYKFQVDEFVTWIQNNKEHITLTEDVDAGVSRGFESHLNESGKSPNTVYKYISLLDLMWERFKKRLKVAHGNPWKELLEDANDAKLPPKHKEPFTPDELNLIFSNVEGKRKLFFMLGYYTGLRLGDVCGLEWKEIELDTRRIVKQPRKTKKRNQKPVMIPLHSDLYSELVEIPKSERTGFLLPYYADKYERDAPAITKENKKFFESLGIALYEANPVKGKRKQPIKGFHSFRHNFVSLCYKEGVPPSIVGSIVGHSNPIITRVYYHNDQQATISAIQALPSITKQIGNNGGSVETETEQAPDLLAIIEDRLQAMDADTWERLRDELMHHIQNSQQ